MVHLSNYNPNTHISWNEEYIGGNARRTYAAGFFGCDMEDTMNTTNWAYGARRQTNLTQ